MQLYIEDFNEEITDLANGIEYHDDEVFVAVGPDLWRTKDLDGDGIADTKESISHGYAVHIGFGAHGMSGAIIGPDGRLWWGIGDIGMNVIDKAGKQWKYPNQGVIVRSELDGSNFEVFAAGLRNTHEFVFDQYGNLISEDNDGDHEGERERLVYITEGSDSGWRSNWQYGKYTDPDNNNYKVWMDEKLSIPRWEGQAAYITPPIQNYVNGPTGMVYNPGTALSERWANHFFVAEFRGSPSNSPIHAFTLKPKGASFELDTTIEVASGLLPTGLDWGPDGALYFGDWIEGWGVKEAGRIWKLDVPGGENSTIRKATKELIQADFSGKESEELSDLLAHPDMRIRQKSQFELVKRRNKGWAILKAKADQSNQTGIGQLARIHGLWGMGQLARKDLFYQHAKAQCIRCHTIWEWGGDAGPVLEGIGSKRSAEHLLTSLIAPSETLSLGYGVVILSLADGETLAGIVQEETSDNITIKIGKDTSQTVVKSTIKEREDVPSSMPGVKDILSKKEIRDMVTFLVSLKE